MKIFITTSPLRWREKFTTRACVSAKMGKSGKSATMQARKLPPDDGASVVKVTRLRRWNDGAYKKYLEACAKVGISINVLYKRAGVDPSSHSTDATKNGRSIEQILALADACGKDPALLIAAGTMGRGKNVAADLELAKLAVVSTLASHMYVALSPSQPSPRDYQKFLNAVTAAMKITD